jgi:hypothetical protein
VRLPSDRAASLCVFFTLTGATLLVLGELTDLMESDVGLNWVNVSFALPLALIAVAAVAVVGDVFLEAIERRHGRRRGRGLTTPMLAGLGFGTAIEIALHHVRQAPQLDASLGLAGAALLLIAAGLHFHASASLRHDSPAPRASHRRPRLPALAGSQSRRLMRQPSGGRSLAPSRTRSGRP